MKRIFIIFILSAFMLNIYAQKDVNNNIEVRPVGNDVLLNGSQILYALPKNVVQIELTIKSTEYMKGPYAGYAEKFLNISDGIIVTDYTDYEIEGVKLKQYSVADSSQYYSISNISNLNVPGIQLNHDGVILAVNSNTIIGGYEFETCSEMHIVPDNNMSPFTDLGVKAFQYEKSETLYKTVQTDTSEVEVPYSQKKTVATSTEMDAEEAAAFIRKLRKRRSKLLFGMVDEVNTVEGDALAIMIEELDKLEQSYLELFMGKEKSVRQKYYFEFEPGSDVVQEQKTLCWFSGVHGVSLERPDVRKGNFDKVIISSSVFGNIANPKISLIDSEGKTPEPIRYGLYYRIPARVVINLKVGSKSIMQKQMQVAQKGHVVPLPVEYIENGDFEIEFYPEYGTIKSISKVK